MKIFASVGFDSFFLSCGVTDEFEKIPYWSKYAKNIGIDFEAVHAPSTMVDSVWKGNEEAVVYEKFKRLLLMQTIFTDFVLMLDTNYATHPKKTMLLFTEKNSFTHTFTIISVMVATCIFCRRME